MPPSKRPVIGAMSAARSARLYRLLQLLRDGSRSRAELATGVRLDMRSFYRDLKRLRELGVRIVSVGEQYRLAGSFDRALARLPFPDPRLNLHEALQLAQGQSAAHRKLRALIRAIIGRGTK